ncbi:hypothetical protein SH668x_001233 [Planctomicrobium sp. SH668]|uniref:hypothetical protein n=1 Tax=Planctomicrobium sp. SH668 TaxID=3448126 RepID=UPI003F5BD63A
MAQTVRILSEHGYIDINDDGAITDSSGMAIEFFCSGPIQKFDVEEYVRTFGQLHAFIDVLNIGYWYGSDGYEAPVKEFRESIQTLHLNLAHGIVN